MNVQLDDLVIAADTLEQGVDYIESVLGVKMPVGGKHPLMATPTQPLIQQPWSRLQNQKAVCRRFLGRAWVSLPATTKLTECELFSHRFLWESLPAVLRIGSSATCQRIDRKQ